MIGAQNMFKASYSNRFFCSLSDSDKADMLKFKETFSRRMAMAGVKPHHRIALGVSGGADSIGLCVLASGWKKDALVGRDEGSDLIDGLLGIVVDHRLRPESIEEAQYVRDIVFQLGINCEVVACDWSEGRPRQGHIQEAAREKRYQIFQDICINQHIGVLLIAHHADDQTELFIIRLSRNSGILGLAGMPFASQLFPSFLLHGENWSSDGIIVLRPLLDFSKEDMYKICRASSQPWVEDPTNRNPSFVRNRIRLSLGNISSCSFRSEVQRVMSACRKTRSYAEHSCRNLIDKSVTIIQQGYTVIDLHKLDPLNVSDLCLSKFIAMVVQFVSQRHRPVRGRISGVLLNYIRNYPCKTSLTAAGCYLSTAPRSKGMKIIVCCSLDSHQPSSTDLSPKYFFREPHSSLHDVEEIVSEAKSYSDRLVPNASDLPFLHLTCPKQILGEAKKLNLLSESTLQSIRLLQSEEAKQFNAKSEQKHDLHSTYGTQSSSTVSASLQIRELCHFTKRFWIMWTICRETAEDMFPMKLTNFNWDIEEVNRDHLCPSCVLSKEGEVVVRNMIEDDWLHLSKLSEGQVSEGHEEEAGQSIPKLDQKEQKISCSRYRQMSAEMALEAIKTIPVSARRSLPVLASGTGILLDHLLQALPLSVSSSFVQAKSALGRRL